MTLSANRTLGFDVLPDATSDLTLGVSDGMVLVDGAFKRFVARDVVLPESATSYVEVTRNGLVSSNTTGFTSGANFLYVVTTNATVITAIEDWRTNPAVGSPNIHLSASASAGVGYQTGAGGAVTQATNRTTGVTLNKVVGTITTHNASLAAEASANFTVTNSTVAIGDAIAWSIQSGTDGGNTAVSIVTVAAGSFVIKVSNHNAAAGAAETGAILINFAVIKGVSA